MPPEPADLSGTVLMGRYRLGGLIARGGMGSVYVAEQLVLHGRFAVKVLSPHYACESEFVARFLQEARAASQIGHPNIVQIIDFGREGEIVFMVMEYLAGSELGVLLRDAGGPLPWSRLGRIVLQICSALGAAHNAGLVHRDIKPSNCLCTVLADGSDLIKVVDFGIAKALDGARLEDQHGERPRTSTGVHLGTFDYMAPEIFHGAAPDPRFDLYSIGVLMYKMLTGSLPFSAARPEQFYALDRSDPPVPSAHPKGRGLPRDVDAIVRRALAADPAERYACMRELAADVERSLNYTPVEPTTQVREWIGTSIDGSPTAVSSAAPGGRMIVDRPRRFLRWSVPLVSIAAALGFVIAINWSTIVPGDSVVEASGAVHFGPTTTASPPLNTRPMPLDTADMVSALDPVGTHETAPQVVDVPPPSTDSVPSDLAIVEGATSAPKSLKARSKADNVERAVSNVQGVRDCAVHEAIDAKYIIYISLIGKFEKVDLVDFRDYEEEECLRQMLQGTLVVKGSELVGKYDCVIKIPSPPSPPSPPERMTVNCKGPLKP